MLLIGLPSNQQWHTSCKYTSPANGNGRTSFGNFEVELEDMLGRHVGNQVEDQELCIMMMMRRRRTTMTIVDIKHSTCTVFPTKTNCMPKKTNVFAMSLKSISLQKKWRVFFKFPDPKVPCLCRRGCDLVKGLQPILTCRCAIAAGEPGELSSNAKVKGNGKSTVSLKWPGEYQGIFAGKFWKANIPETWTWKQRGFGPFFGWFCWCLVQSTVVSEKSSRQLPH